MKEWQGSKRRDELPPPQLGAWCPAETGRPSCVQTPELDPGESSLTPGASMDTRSGADCPPGALGGGKLTLDQLEMQKRERRWLQQGSGAHERELGSNHHNRTTTSRAVSGRGEPPEAESEGHVDHIGDMQCRKPALTCQPRGGLLWPGCINTSEIELCHFSPNFLSPFSNSDGSGNKKGRRKEEGACTVPPSASPGQA